MGTTTVSSVRSVGSTPTRSLPARVGRFALKIIFAYGTLLYFLMSEEVAPALQRAWRFVTFPLAIGLVAAVVTLAVLAARVTRSAKLDELLRR